MKKVFIIEDDRDIAEVVEMALEEKYHVKVQTDINLVLDSLHRFLPDIIMIDNQLGQKMAGDIMSEIKNIDAYKNIPFVLFSGHHEIKRIALELDADAYLAKPFELGELYSCIDGVLTKCA